MALPEKIAERLHLLAADRADTFRFKGLVFRV